MDECHKCGFYDPDRDGCTCSSYDKWYACPVESRKEENQKALEEYAKQIEEQENGMEKLEMSNKFDFPGN